MLLVVHEKGMQFLATLPSHPQTSENPFLRVGEPIRGEGTLLVAAVRDEGKSVFSSLHDRILHHLSENQFLCRAEKLGITATPEKAQNLGFG